VRPQLSGETKDTVNSHRSSRLNSKSLAGLDSGRRRGMAGGGRGKAGVGAHAQQVLMFEPALSRQHLAYGAHARYSPPGKADNFEGSVIHSGGVVETQVCENSSSL